MDSLFFRLLMSEGSVRAIFDELDANKNGVLEGRELERMGMRVFTAFHPDTNGPSLEDHAKRLGIQILVSLHLACIR